MFSKSRPTPASESAHAAPANRMASSARTTFSVFGPDVVVTGNVSASVDLHVEGRIEGDIACANLVQGNESLIKGSIVAETARLSGTVEGSITARELTLSASARITGDVTYESLTIEQGSQVDGRFSHRRAGGNGTQRSLPDATPAQVEVIPAT